MKKIKLALVLFFTTLVVFALANPAYSAVIFEEHFDNYAMHHFEIVVGPDNVESPDFDDSTGNIALHMDKALYGEENMVILSDISDTSGIWYTRLSYDWWEHGAGTNEYIQVDVISPYDYYPGIAIHDPSGIPDFEVQHAEFNLPFEYDDSPGVSIRFTLHSDDPGDHLYLDNIIFSGDAVPIPGAVWLLGSGLIGIVGIRKKFKK